MPPNKTKLNSWLQGSSSGRKCPYGVSIGVPPCPLPDDMMRDIQMWSSTSRWAVECFPLFLFFSLNYMSAPKFYAFFISFSSLLIVLCGPYFCYVSFDLFQFGPSIEIDYIIRFQFSPPFNFWIDFKSLNIFGTKKIIFSILSFN